MQQKQIGILGKSKEDILEVLNLYTGKELVLAKKSSGF